MKKVLCLILIGVLCFGCLSGCNESDVNTKQEENIQKKDEESKKSDDSKTDETKDEASAHKIELGDLPSIDLTGIDTYGLPDNISDIFEGMDIGELSDLSPERIAELLKTHGELVEDIKNAFKNTHINVNISDKTGEITLDAAILFDVDKFEVSEEGKDFLKTFIPLYTKVVCDEKYQNFIGSLVIEGHTDTDGDYDYNKQLSINRAKSVRNYILSDDVNISIEDRRALNALARAEGYSYDDPIKDKNGNVDKAKSRRVAFRFTVKVK